MSDLVKEIMGKFIDLSQEEKAITAESDAAFKEYNDYCADSEKDLNEKIDEIHKKMEKLNYYLDYAREHATELEEAPEAFDTPDGTLESIRQTIKLDSTNDPNAETLYIKATGKKMFYEQEIERTRKLIEGSKVQAKRQLDSETAKLNNRKAEHFEKVRAYVQSNDFAEYLKILVYDKSAFNSPGTVLLGDDAYISLGQRRVKLFVPMDIEQDIALSSNGEYNAAAHTIGAPYQVSTKKGGTLFLEHDERNGQYLLGGIQRLLLNFIKYFGNDITRCVFCDPDRYSVDSLGNIAALGKGLNPFITVPKSKEEIEGKINRLASRAAEAPTPDKVSRILVLQSFPEKYSPELAAKVLDICKNAEQNGVLVVLTHAVSSEATPVEAEIRAMAEVIRSRNGGFWIERERESLFWYSAPSDISEEVRKVYVEKRNQDALKAAQEPEAAVEAPKPAPAPVEPSKPEVKAEPAPAPVEPPKPEVKAEPAPVPVESPKPKVNAEPAPVPVEAPKPEVKAAPAPAPKPAPAPAPAVAQPKAEDREVIMTVLSEISDQLPPPALDPFEALNVGVQRQEIDPELTYRITDRQPAAPASPFAPTAPAAPVQSTQLSSVIGPDEMTYKITDFPDKVTSMNIEHPNSKSSEERVSLQTHQTAAREPIEVTEDMKYKITDFPDKVASMMNPGAPTAPAAPVQSTQLSSVIGPDEMTYKITDFPDKVTSMNIEHPNSKASEEKVSLQTHQTAAREPIEVTEDMRYKITDFPDKVASMNAPKPTYVDPEEKPGAIKTVIDAGKNVIDAGVRKINEIVDSRKNSDYDEKVELPADAISMDAPVQPTQLSSVIGPDEMTYKITDFPDKVTSMNIEHPNSKASEEKVSLQTHQTAAREPIEVTEDMRYKITDFPDKVASMNAPKPTYVDPEEKPGAIKTVIDAGKNVIDAGVRKINEIVGKSDYDDEKVELSADEISMETTQLSTVIGPEDMTYKITDFPDKVTSMNIEHPNSKANEEKVSLQTHQTAAREPIEVTEDMRYKITDFPDKVASMNAPKPTYVDPEDKPGAIKTVIDAGKNVIDAGKNVIDAGKRKIEEMVESRKNTDYPIRSLLDDEKLETPADQISMDAEPADEKPSQPAHQTAARETAEVTPDMTYKITDFPDKVASMNAPKPGQEPAAKAPTVGENEDMTYRITDKLPTVEKQSAASAVTIDPEPEPVEDVFGKGVRKLPAIPIGKSVNGRFTNLNIGGNITYICGNRGDDRKTVSDRIITQITASTHPDDVELWLFDCGDGEFMKYADDPAAHIKYLVFDTGADSSTDFAEVVAAELDRRVEAFAENGWSDVSDIPADVFMPRIMVAVNAFPRFAENIVGTTKYFGRNHNDKLSKLFKSCGGYGIHFLLIGDEFSDGGERPNCLEGVTIGCAVAVSGRDRGISSLFSDIKLYDNEIESLRKIPSGCAFVAEADSASGLTLVKLGGENAVNEHTYTEASAYSDNLEEYLGKNPFIGDRKAASRFDDRGDYRAEQIKNRDEGECLLFLGEPCRFMGEYPIRLFDDFGENLLTIAPAREKGSAALMVRAALRSLEEQAIPIEILACRSNPVYSELHRSGDLDGLEVFEGGKAEARIKELADMLDKGKRPNVFEIVLGGDLLMASMSASDMLPVLKRALVKGPRDGAHFMFISGSVAATEPEFLSLFRHKLVFACPYNEAEKILRDPNCDLPENAFRLSNDYDELTILPYSM